jgi:tRNA(Ile)-lysidine synthase
MANLVKKIQNTAFQNDLWKRGSKIVLGVSGGPDSVCLLDILAKIRPKYNLKLNIAHVNYGLRGKDSGQDEKFVRKLAQKYGIPIFVFNVKIKKISENILRDVRYEFFEKVRAKNNFDTIAVGHNLEDQVETFLMRIIRGSGLQGLSAMRFRNVSVIRPLLGTSRIEILEYLKKNKLTHRTDKTNMENLFLRNKIRNRLIPYLEKNFNPNIKKTIFDATASIGEDYSLIQQMEERSFRTRGMKNSLSVKKILTFHPALQRRIILRLISEEKTDLNGIEAGHVEEIIKALKSTKSKNQVVLFKGLKMTRKGDKVVISRL